MFESQSDDILNQSAIDNLSQKSDEYAREFRMLHHIKQDKIVLGEGTPLDNEGADGDIHLRVIDDGVRLCIKAGGQWFRFKPEEEE